MRAYLYILSVAQDPDYSEQSVPFAIDEAEIFFGPCKKRLRQLLRKEFLRDTDSCEPEEDIYVIGFNGSNPSSKRKVIWAGKIKRVMTFARADVDLSSPRYDGIRQGTRPPLHVRPEYSQGNLVGYSKVGFLHSENWIYDLVQNPNRFPEECISGGKMLAPPDRAPFDSFDRDACLLLENRFYASGTGLEIRSEMLEVLRSQQQGRAVDEYAIFGRRADGTADGRVGSWLELTGKPAQDFVSAVLEQASCLPRSVASGFRKPERICGHDGACAPRKRTPNFVRPARRVCG
ncbi:MAG TPA: hypothetical protein VMB18_08295 [Terriglobales bacterium]|nr:hypothetical protein [Terriglobales bacterium]